MERLDIKVDVVDTLEEATKKAYEISSEKDIILLVLSAS